MKVCKFQRVPAGTPIQRPVRRRPNLDEVVDSGDNPFINQPTTPGPAPPAENWDTGGDYIEMADDYDDDDEETGEPGNVELVMVESNRNNVRQAQNQDGYRWRDREWRVLCRMWDNQVVMQVAIGRILEERGLNVHDWRVPYDGDMYLSRNGDVVTSVIRRQRGDRTRYRTIVLTEED